MTPELDWQRQGDLYILPNDPGEETNPTNAPRRSVSDREAGILSCLAAGKTVLEIGTGTGFSTHALAHAASCVTTLDTSSWVKAEVFPKLAALPNVICRSGGDRAFFNNLAFHMVFIDGDHNVEPTLEDLGFAIRVLHPYGLIVLHDARDPRVRLAINQIDWLWGCVLPTEMGLWLGEPVRSV
jgi:predicted O-methyltransferase YrrM